MSRSNHNAKLSCLHVRSRERSAKMRRLGLKTSQLVSQMSLHPANPGSRTRPHRWLDHSSGAVPWANPRKSPRLCQRAYNRAPPPGQGIKLRLQDNPAHAVNFEVGGWRSSCYRRYCAHRTGQLARPTAATVPRQPTNTLLCLTAGLAGCPLARCGNFHETRWRRTTCLRIVVEASGVGNLALMGIGDA